MKQKTKQLVFTLSLLFFSFALVAQQRTVKGKVMDESGAPLANVSYVVKGTPTGGMTDADGNFSVAVTGNNTVLVFSSVGYQSQEVAVGTSSDLTVSLRSQAAGLQEVVVTALGIKKQKASLGYAVQEVSGGVIAAANETNMTNALSGKVSGLQVVRSSNGAGGSAKLVLRGYSSVEGDNQPLIVVDGVPMDNFTGSTENGFWNGQRDYGNGLGDLNPDDIASVSVLKGQSAAALYGSRGGNGVIMITTKSGTKQPGLGLTVTSTLSTESMFLTPELQSTYGQGDQGIFKADNNTSWGPKIEGQSVTKWDGTTAPLELFDNMKAFLRKGSSQNYGLSLQQQYGGTSVYSSLNYLEDRSIIPGNKLTRLNVTSRAVSKFGNDNRWTSDIKLAYNNTAGYNRPINGKDQSSVYAILMLPRSLNIRDFAAGVDQFGKMLWYPGALAWTPNPYWLYRYALNQDKRDRMMLNGSLKYQITDWLSAEVRGGADMYTTNTEDKIYDGGPLSNSYSTGKTTFVETNYSAMINASKKNLFGKLGGSVMIGGNLMDHKWSSISGSTGKLEVPNLFSLTNSAGTTSVGAGYSHKKINSLYGSLEFNYDDWIFLTLTNRNDWSSALSAANRSYSYPSVNLSYVVTNMLESVGTTVPEWLSYAKVRASYASVGNDMGPYNLYNGYDIGKDPLGGTTAEKESLLKDPNVVNELLKSVELGAEMRFLDNRLGIDFTWYKSNATNQLIRLPMDPMSGYSKKIINAGNIQNKGVELVIDAGIVRSASGFRWDLRANYSTNRNLVIDIAKDSGVTSYDILGWDNLSVKAENGKYFGSIYGTKFVRVDDPSNKDYGKLILDGNGLPQATGQSYLLGNQQADALIGITNNFSYKNFDLSILVDGRFGGEIFSATQGAMQANGSAAVTAPGGSRDKFIVEGVVSDGSGGYTANTKEVSQQDYWSRIGTSGNVGIGEANIYDATNIRVRNVSLGYTFPKGMLGNTFQKVKVAASCNNVWMITSHMRGIDPESVYATGSNAVGFESGAFPTMRSFQLSLSLGF
ncbi:MAG: SusC/RagA family TonB-linked outer membrane protein [Chitinophagaceae bacterium]|nr:SusC/RagA family TonB-linked outer membrane protein [Chitinophagaceae bacterium]